MWQHMLIAIFIPAYRDIVPQEAGCASSCEFENGQHIFVHARIARHDDTACFKTYSRTFSRAAARCGTTRSFA